MIYSIKFRRKWWMPWTTIKGLVGHKYDLQSDRMLLFFQDGGLYELFGWSKFDVKLGTDWVLATRRIMEKESGHEIKLAVGK